MATAKKKPARAKKMTAAQAKKSLADRIDLNDPRVKKLVGAVLGVAEELDSDLVEQLVKSVEKKTAKPAAAKKASAPKKTAAKPAKAKAAAKTTKKSTAAKKAPEKRVLHTVPLNWKEVWYTNCPMVSANNIDQELGWCREEFKKIGVEYDFLRHTPLNDWYPHYIHNLDNLIRFGGLNPAIAVHADIRRTVLLGATWVYEGGCMAVRADDNIFKMQDLKGKKIALSKSLNTLKNDWWRVQEHMGILNMLKMNDMTVDDVEIVEFPYPDDWYNDPKMLAPINNPTELWAKRDHKHDLAFRPEENSLLDGTVDAIYTQSKVFQHLQEDTGKIKMIEDLSKYPDWTMQVANTPAVITCTDVMAKKHPELVVAYMKAMVRVGRWANEHKHAAAVILNRQTFYLDAEHTYEGIKHVDMVPSLNAMNMQCIKVGTDFMFKHGYIKHNFDVDAWAAPEFLEQAVTEWLKEEWEKKSYSKLAQGGGLDVEGVRIG